MVKVEVKGGWFKDPSSMAIIYVRQQYVEETELLKRDAVKPEIAIPWRAYVALLDYVKENEKDIVKTDRTEDLKIIHRLLDILDRRCLDGFD